MDYNNDDKNCSIIHSKLKRYRKNNTFIEIYIFNVIIVNLISSFNNKDCFIIILV